MEKKFQKRNGSLKMMKKLSAPGLEGCCLALANSTDKDIEVFIKKLDDLNRSACFLTVSGAQRNHNKKCCCFQSRHKWQFNKGQIMNYSALCQLKLEDIGVIVNVR
jgi:hypothetical protein